MAGELFLCNKVHLVERFIDNTVQLAGNLFIGLFPVFINFKCIPKRLKVSLEIVRDERTW